MSDKFNNYEYYAGEKPGVVGNMLPKASNHYGFGIMLDRLHAMYRKREKIIADNVNKVDNLSAYTPVSEFKWLFHLADTSLVFDIGDLVKLRDTGEYAVVSDYCFSVLFPYGDVTINRLLVTTAKESKSVYSEAVFRADIPKEIVDVVKAQLRAQCSCPLVGDNK